MIWQTPFNRAIISFPLAEITSGESFSKAVVASLMVTAGTIFLLSVLLAISERSPAP